MSALQNPVPHLLEAGEAALRVAELQKKLFFANQAQLARTQMIRATWLAITVILLNLMLILSFFWIGFGLHERGWSAFSLAGLSGLVLGLLALSTGWLGLRIQQRSQLHVKS